MVFRKPYQKRLFPSLEPPNAAIRNLFFSTSTIVDAWHSLNGGDTYTIFSLTL